MPSVALQLDPRELATDKAAAASVNFCSLWPTAKPILQQLATVISSSLVKFAINTVISAGDAYCGSSPSTRLAQFGITPPPNMPIATEEFLSTLSDQELQTLARIQQQAQQYPVPADFGNYVL